MVTNRVFKDGAPVAMNEIELFIGNFLATSLNFCASYCNYLTLRILFTHNFQKRKLLRKQGNEHGEGE